MKSRYEEIMSYLGSVEEEFSQLAVSNRSASVLGEQEATPAKKVAHGSNALD